MALVMAPLAADATTGSARLIRGSHNKMAHFKSKVKFTRHAGRHVTGKHRRVGASRYGVSHSAGYSDLVMDGNTGRILHATAPDELRHPASLTKMMTLYLTFTALKQGKLRLDQYLPVSQTAANQEPSRLGLRPGRQVRVEDAVLGMAIKSANDATVVLAEAIGGSIDGFAKMMTDKAHELGMRRTVFRNPSGLPNPEQVTTARDMAILGYALIHHFPQFYPYFSRENFSYAGISHHNHNRLMSRYQGMDGIKTGYIRASGFNLVASTVRGNTRLIASVFGGRSALERDNRMASLLDQSFAQLHDNRRGVNTAENSNKDNDTEFVAVPTTISALETTTAVAENAPASAGVAAAGHPKQPEVVVVADNAEKLSRINDRSHYQNYYTLTLSFVGMAGIIIFLKQRKLPIPVAKNPRAYTTANPPQANRIGWV
ncbi:MAG: D-alanyl-D-alanine carboxypeptidase [Magnetococcales bacterium]|nr:D-alanyl-D-alanine carboxypeptidase [Magnetococcales bacterium]